MVRKISPEYAKQMQISMVMDPENDFDCLNAIYVQEKDFDDLFVAAAIVDKEYDGEITEVSDTYRWKYRYQSFLGLLSYGSGRYNAKRRDSNIAYRYGICSSANRTAKESKENNSSNV